MTDRHTFHVRHPVWDEWHEDATDQTNKPAEEQEPTDPIVLRPCQEIAAAHVLGGLLTDPINTHRMLTGPHVRRSKPSEKKRAKSRKRTKAQRKARRRNR